MTSCFESSIGRIICFLRKSFPNPTATYYTIYIFSCCFSEKKSYKAEISTSSNTFYKGIYLKEQIGVFIYFLNEDSIQPNIIIKNFKDDNIQDFNSFGNITLQSEFNSNYMLNDIIKVSDTKISYISPNLNKNELNVVIISLYNNDQNINIRYYKIPIYEQNHYMIYKEIRLFLYINQYITF